MKNPICVFIFLLGISFEGLCQTGLISGRIIDAQSQEPLPFAHVFINNTTIGTTTDVEGNFLLKNVPVGSNEIIYSFVGYQNYSGRVTVLEGQPSAVVIRLTPLLQELSAVEVKGTRDKEWMRQLRYFEKQFFGEAANQCKINNPWVIDFITSDNTNVITATASGPIEITNQFLGYTIMFYLKKFQSNNQSYLIDGNAYFIEMTDAEARDKWVRNRTSVYYGSDRHLFKSILANKVSEEGFRLYVDKKGEMDVNSRSSMFYSEVGKKVIEFSTQNSVTAAGRPYEYNIQLNGRTEIHYLNETAGVRYYKDVTGQVSWMEVKGNVVRVNNNGVVLNPGNAVYSGEMSNNRISTLLPLDYQPDAAFDRSYKNTTSTFLVEKVYLHTNKPYYYPGETIWLKGYMKYNQPVSSDSVSKVLYVELINQAKEVILSKKLKIDSGLTDSYFLLPDTLRKGNYVLRSYTSWMRNFGDPCYFVQPIPILSLNEKPERTTAHPSTRDSILIVLPDKASYHPREKINLTIQLLDVNNLSAQGSLSISVTDERQVSYVAEQATILSDLRLPDLPKPSKIVYPLEHGLVLSGILKNDKQKPVQSNLTIVVGKFENVLMADTDVAGRFELNGLEYYDSVEFSFQATDKRGKPIGTISLTQPSVPPITWKEYKQLVITDAGSVQRLISEHESSKEAILLNEVIITDKPMDEPTTEVQHKIFGKPDQVIMGSDLLASGSGNLVLALRGRVPGLSIAQEADGKGGFRYTIKIRGAASFSLSTEPLVLIDGVPIGGAPGESVSDRLALINPGNVERVEVTTRTNSMYGDVGRNGVIAVYTKAAPSGKFSNLQGGKTMQVFKLHGFSTRGKFRSPDYDDPTIEKDKPDYRSTVYWNPDLKTDPAGQCVVTFFASDLTGRYRVVVEGVSESGEPLRHESFILIEN